MARTSDERRIEICMNLYFQKGGFDEVMSMICRALDLCRSGLSRNVCAKGHWYIQLATTALMRSAVLQPVEAGAVVVDRLGASTKKVRKCKTEYEINERKTVIASLHFTASNTRKCNHMASKPGRA